MPASNLLIRGQQKKRIEPQVMALLLLLINAKGQVVSRQQIRQSIWPDVIVGDEVITRLIFQLRNILADDAKNPQFIETIPKKGYLFIADVEFPSLNQANDAITGNETASATNTQQKQNILAISSSSLSSKTWRLLFLMTFLSLILMVIYNQINAPSIDSAEFSSSQINGVKPVTKLIGSEKDFAVSPNGQEMVFVHESSNSSELFLKNIQNMNSAKAITEDKWRPFSPIWINELTIAYIRHHNGQYQIVKHTLNAADMTKETILFESNQRIYTLTYLGPKHHKIIFNQKRDQTITELKALDLKHLQVSLLKDQFVGIPEQVYSPSYSIQSNQLYFVAITQGNDSLMALDYNTKQISLISEAFERVNSFTFIKESQQIIIAGSHNGAIGIWHLAVNQGKIAPVLLAASGEWITTVFWHSDQNVIYYDTFFRHSDILKMSSSSPQVDQLSQLNSHGNEYSAKYSELHHAIFYISDRSGSSELWRYDLDTKEAHQVTKINAKWISKPVLSNDGKRVVLAYKYEHFVLGVFELDSGETMVSIDIPYQKYPLSWSDNDQFIYVSEHRININLFRYQASDLSSELEQKYGGLLAEKNKHNRIVFVDYATNKLVEKELNNQSQRILLDQIPQLDQLIPQQVKFNGKGLYAGQRHDQKYSLYYYPVERDPDIAVQQQLVMQIHDFDTITDINQDASVVLVIRRHHADGDVMKVELTFENTD